MPAPGRASSSRRYLNSLPRRRELAPAELQAIRDLPGRRGAQLFTVALTENIGNINNTPDIGLQVGWSLNPGWN